MLSAVTIKRSTNMTNSFSFEQQVIDRSRQLPVVVDFWAPWCGPCRMLGPTLEKLAEEQAGRWELVKVNTEDHPEIAQQYRIMSIPNVKLFRDGEVAGEFVGAQPQRMIEKWLDDLIPSQEAEDLTMLLKEEKAWPDRELAVRLEAFLEERGDVPLARLALARHRIFDDPAQARELTAGFSPVDEGYDRSVDLLQLADFLEAELQAGAPVEEALLAARKALRSGELSAALDDLIRAVTLDKSYADDLPRKTTIALFHLLGETHELTRKYRWKFDMALY